MNSIQFKKKIKYFITCEKIQNKKRWLDTKLLQLPDDPERKLGLLFNFHIQNFISHGCFKHA